MVLLQVALVLELRPRLKDDARCFFIHSFRQTFYFFRSGLGSGKCSLYSPFKHYNVCTGNIVSISLFHPPGPFVCSFVMNGGGSWVSDLIQVNRMVGGDVLVLGLLYD